MITNPAVWTQALVHKLKVVAWLVIFSFNFLTSVKVNIVLPAIPKTHGDRILFNKYASCRFSAFHLYQNS